MKRVLVTGARGLLGRHCLPLLLDSGFEVHAVSTMHQESTSNEIEWHRADLLDSDQTSELLSAVRPTHLLHLAWYTVPGKYWASPHNVRWVTASLSLVEALAALGSERVVIAGTCAEYDWSYGYCTEGLTPLRPNSLYGTSKHALHLLAEAYCENTGLSFAWGRIFFVFGPGEQEARLVPATVLALLNGDIAECAQPAKFRDFLYVKDAASAFVALLESSQTGPFNIASGVPVSIGDLARRLGVLTRREDLLRFAKQPRADEPEVLIGNVSRIREKVGWSSRYSLDQGLQETVSWWTEINRS